MTLAPYGQWEWSLGPVHLGLDCFKTTKTYWDGLGPPTATENGRWVLSTWVQTIFRQLKWIGMVPWAHLRPRRMAAGTLPILEMGCWSANLKLMNWDRKKLLNKSTYNYWMKGMLKHRPLLTRWSPRHRRSTAPCQPRWRFSSTGMPPTSTPPPGVGLCLDLTSTHGEELLHPCHCPPQPWGHHIIIPHLWPPSAPNRTSSNSPPTRYSSLPS
jgi:hypothetical protein